MKKSPIALCLLLTVLLSQQSLIGNDFAFRQFTSSDGKPLKAKLEMFDGSTVKIKTPRGATFELPLDRFSPEDQTFIKNAYKPDTTKSAYPAANLDVEQGKVLGPVQATEKSSYHLYVPTSLVEGRKAPLYMITLAGGGKKSNIISGLQKTSELLGAIIALSVEASNANARSKSKDKLVNNQHGQNCVNHLLDTLPIDKKRIIFGGNSGGAATAFQISHYIKALAVINKIGYKSTAYKPQLKYCYGISGSADYNRYHVALAARDMKNNGFHRFVPGGHVDGGKEKEIDALFWVHCKHLGDKQSKYGEEASQFIDKALTWLEQETPSGNVYHNAILLGENFEFETKQKGRHIQLLNSLKSNPEHVLYHEGLITFNEFSVKHLKTSHENSLQNFTDPKVATKSKEFEETYGSIKEFAGIIKSFQSATAK